MNILLCHNYYQYRGGEDISFEDEARMLESRGHTVHRYTVHNDQIGTLNGWDVTRRSLWSEQVFDELRKLLQARRYDVLHCTNTFPLISPAAYDAARAEGVPIVQSLRNYRLLCPTSFLMRQGRVCEECVGRATAWPGILHGCYRDSRIATAVVATISLLHRRRRTTQRDATYYYTPTEFARHKLIEGGVPSDRIAVKNNFVEPDPGVGFGTGGYAVCVGRLSPEKGIDTLLQAWSKLTKQNDQLVLKIVGGGPMAAQVRAAVDSCPQIQWLGELSHSETLSIIGEAAMLVMPSVWYETFGRTMIEAFACGTPVVASRLGAMAEVVLDGATGLHFTAGDADDLAEKILSLSSDRERLAQMRLEARREYLKKYTVDTNYRQLISIYERAIKAGCHPRPANDA